MNHTNILKGKNNIIITLDAEKILQNPTPHLKVLERLMIQGIS